MSLRKRTADGRRGYQEGFESGVRMTLKDIEGGRSVEDLREELPRLLDMMRATDAAVAMAEELSA